MEKRHLIKENEKEAVREKIKSFLQEREEVSFAYLHGSFLEDLGFRDIDLAVYLQGKEAIPERCLDYECSLSSDLEKVVTLPVDVKVLNVAPLGFQYQVTKGALLFCRDKTFHANYLEKTWNEYLDFDFHRRESLKDLLSP